MMHNRRRWCVSVVASPEELASMLTGSTWTLCAGFRVQGHDYLFLNDATHEDGAGEWGIYGAVNVMLSCNDFPWNCPQSRAFFAT